MDTNNKGLVLKTPIGTPLSIVYHAEDRYLFIRNLNGADSGRVVLNREDLPALLDYLVDIGFAERLEQLAPVVPESVRDVLDDALHEIAVRLDRAEANGEKWFTDHAEWHRSRWQDAKNWLDSLPKPQPEPPSHPLSHLPTPPKGVDLSKLRWNGEQWEVHQGYPIGHVVVDSAPNSQDGDS